MWPHGAAETSRTDASRRRSFDAFAEGPISATPWPIHRLTKRSSVFAHANFAPKLSHSLRNRGLSSVDLDHSERAVGAPKTVRRVTQRRQNGASRGSFHGLGFTWGRWHQDVTCLLLSIGVLNNLDAAVSY
jgi:hypothetical protein